jgi:hypothetical protein
LVLGHRDRVDRAARAADDVERGESKEKGGDTIPGEGSQIKLLQQVDAEIAQEGNVDL